MISISFFFLDTLFYVLLGRHATNFLTVYFIYLGLNKKSSYPTLFFLMVQSCLVYGRFGLALVYILPVSIAILLFRSSLHDHWRGLFGYFLVAASAIIEGLIVKKWLFSFDWPAESFFYSIFSNFIVLSLIFLIFGTRGDRSTQFLL